MNVTFKLSSKDFPKLHNEIRKNTKCLMCSSGIVYVQCIVNMLLHLYLSIYHVYISYLLVIYLPGGPGTNACG